MPKKPMLYPFMVYYIKTISTWNNEWQQKGKRILMLESKPTGDNVRTLETKMADDYIDRHRKRRKNLADVTYRVTRICPVKPKS